MKKIILSFLLLIVSLFGISYAVPSLSNNESSMQSVGYKITEITKGNDLKQNIINLFFPSAGGRGGIIWEKLRIIAVGLLFVFFVRAGALFVLHAGDEGELKKAKLNMVYILYGAFLIFASVWLLGMVLNVGGESVDAEHTLVATQKTIIGGLLMFFKSMAYYLAIIMVTYFGYKIINAQEKEDKIKSAKNGVLNVIIALIALKVFDYLYFIAQGEGFKRTAGGLITGTGKALAWLLGVIIVLAIIYAASLLFMSKGDEKDWKNAKVIIRNVFLVIFVLFLFVVIVYDLIKNFAS